MHKKSEKKKLALLLAYSQQALARCGKDRVLCTHAVYICRAKVYPRIMRQLARKKIQSLYSYQLGLQSF